MTEILGIICLVIWIFPDVYTFIKAEKNKKNIARFLGIMACVICAIICLILQIYR